MKSKQKIIVITGPTATGKSALAVQLAGAIGGEVVSADSMQVYKHMDIGTAKPAAAEMRGVPHHMIDVVAPWEDYSVARYVGDAAKCIDDILTRKKIPVLAGGTGLYIDSLLAGREFSAVYDTDVRKALEAEYDELGGAAMLLKLRSFDPDRAAVLHENDKKRIVRAIEIYINSGKTISQHDLETKMLPSRYNAVVYGLMFSERSALYEKIDCRVEIMLKNGLKREVSSLIEMGVPLNSTAMQAIGYKEMVCVVRGECDMKSAAERIKMESRRYAKRQLTWLRRNVDVKWLTYKEAPDHEDFIKIIQGSD